MPHRTTKFVDWGEADTTKNKAAADAQFADINTRLEHLAKRMDEAENLLKRVYDHLSQYHRI